MTRSFYQITDVDNTNPWAIPLQAEEFALSTRNSLLLSVGADGAFDLHGDRRSPRAPRSAVIDVLLQGNTPAEVGTRIDDMLKAAEGGTREKGRRKLWRREVSGLTGARWTYARLASAEYTREPMKATFQQARLEFAVPDPNFYDPITTAYLNATGFTAETLSSAVVPEPIAPDYAFAKFAIGATPFSFTLKNAGDLETQRVVFYLVSQAVNGFTNPKIENLTTGQDFSTSTDGATASHRLSVNASPGLGRAQLSVNAGSAWTDDTLNLSMGSLQSPLMELQPGDNLMRYTDGGTPNLLLYVWWAHAYRE